MHRKILTITNLLIFSFNLYFAILKKIIQFIILKTHYPSLLLFFSSSSNPSFFLKFSQSSLDFSWNDRDPNHFASAIMIVTDKINKIWKTKLINLTRVPIFCFFIMDPTRSLNPPARFFLQWKKNKCRFTDKTLEFWIHNKRQAFNSLCVEAIWSICMLYIIQSGIEGTMCFRAKQLSTITMVSIDLFHYTYQYLTESKCSKPFELILA